MYEILITVGICYITLIILLLGICYGRFKVMYKYFETRGIPYAKPTFPFGNLSDWALYKWPINFIYADIYTQSRHVPIVGLFSLWKEQILINDPEIIKRVLVDDFDTFKDRGIYHNKMNGPVNAHVFTVKGSPWKSMRKKLTPLFSSERIKAIHPTLENCAKMMMTNLHSPLGFFMLYTLEAIATAAFGVQTESLHELLYNYIKLREPKIINFISLLIHQSVQVDIRHFIAQDYSTFRKERANIFLKMLQCPTGSKKDLQDEHHDFPRILENLNTSEGSPVFVTKQDLAAQALMFTSSGCETTSSTIDFCLFEISQNPEVQKRLHLELDALPDLSHDSIQNCEYLDMVVSETLRKHPPLGFLNRECSRDYEIPNTNFVIEKDTLVLISIQGLQNDPDLFPKPEKFDPERFSKENRDSIKPFSYMPFGGGPRTCIGEKFAKMLIKTGVATFLRRYRILPFEDYERFTVNENSLITVVDGISLDCRRRC